MAGIVTGIHIRYNDTRGVPQSISYDEEEYHVGLFTMDEVVKEALADGATKMVIEVTAEFEEDED